MFIDIQSSIHRKLLSIPPAARQAYDRANADFRAARRSVAITEECAESVAADAAELGRKRAAVVINAKPVSAEQARANVIAAFERQQRADVDALSAAIERVRPNKTAEVKAETASDRKLSLAELILAESAD
jgi:hypothetical protein